MLSALGAGFIRLLGRTWRLRTVETHNLDEARRIAPQVIYAFWHGRLLAPSYTHRNREITVLASEHRDGELMGQTIRRLGFGHVRGSSTRGGARAIRDLVAALAAGADLALTVDGPRGPRHVVKPGPLEIAKLSGCCIVPVAISSRSHWQLSSWDGFQIPRPFTRIQYMFGSPVVIAPDAAAEDLERRRVDIEERLNRMTEMNDESVRRD